MHLVADRAEPNLQGVTTGCGPDELDELCTSRLPLVILMPKPFFNPVVRIELPVWGGDHEEPWALPTDRLNQLDRLRVRDVLNDLGEQDVGVLR